MAVDDAYTKFLLHCDGLDNGTTFVDEAGSTVPLYGNVCTKTGTKKFGTASAYFDGNGDYIYYPAANANYAFGTGNFTVDMWINFVTTPQYASIYECRSLDGADGFHFGCNAAGSNDKKLHIRTGGVNYVGATVLDANTWYHVAVVGEGTTVKVYLNGVLEITATISYNFTNSLLLIGTYNVGDNYFWHGYMDEIRVSKGIARWTADFTPPTAAYGSSAPVSTGIMFATFI